MEINGLGFLEQDTAKPNSARNINFVVFLLDIAFS
jgi:hypothetical protein